MDDIRGRYCAECGSFDVDYGTLCDDCKQSVLFEESLDENERLCKENAELKALLREVAPTFTGYTTFTLPRDGDFVPVESSKTWLCCKNKVGEGHKPDCKLAAVLKDGE